MTTTLALNYTPRKGSYTKILFDEFISLAACKTVINHIDLGENPPELLTEKNLNLIMEWNNGKRNFTQAEQDLMANHNSLIDAVLAADTIVLAFPIYNFTMPATVKAWIDAIVVSDKTFSFNPETGFSGLCNGKKALSIMVSGFDYKQSGTIKEYASATLQQNFNFMGISLEQISAIGVDQNRDQLDYILEQAKKEISTLVKKWYG